MSIQVGSGTAIPVDMTDVSTAESGTTLSDLESYINTNFTSHGVKASIVTNSDGTVEPSTLLPDARRGGNADREFKHHRQQHRVELHLPRDGRKCQPDGGRRDPDQRHRTPSTNLIPGVTFQLLAPSAEESDGSLEPVQVVIANDNSGVESTVNQFVTDYNSLISAINTQEGNTSSGNAEPLFGSPTLSLLQQQLLSGLNTQNPNGYLDSISSTAAITLSGSITIQVGSGAAQTVNVGDSSTPDTLSGLAAAINAANIGVTAGIATSNGQSTLALTSQTAGSNGALTVTSAITATAPTPLKYSDTTTYTSSDARHRHAGRGGRRGRCALRLPDHPGGRRDSRNRGHRRGAKLSRGQHHLHRQRGRHALRRHERHQPASGVSAALDQAGTGLTLTSGANGAAGALTVTSNIVDTTSPTSTALNYNTSSDINSLTTLGISVNNDGSLDLRRQLARFGAEHGLLQRGGLLPEREQLGPDLHQHADQCRHKFFDGHSGAGLQTPTAASNPRSTRRSPRNRATSRPSRSSLTAELNQANEIMQQLPTRAERHERALLGDHRL